MEEKKVLKTYMSILNNICPSTSCLLIGSGKGSYIEIFKDLNLEDVILVEADSQQIDRMYRIHDIPSNYRVENSLIYRDEKEITFNIASNPFISCFKSIDYYKSIMPNVSLEKSIVLKSYSLESFSKKKLKKEFNWLIIDTFTSLEILKDSRVLLEYLDIIICKVLYNRVEELHLFMLENTFSLVQSFDESNPEIIIKIYIKNFKSKNKQLRDNENKILQNTIEALIKRRDNLVRNDRLKDKLILERDEIISNLYKGNCKIISDSYLKTLSSDNKIEIISSWCIKQKDILEAIDDFLFGNRLTKGEKFNLCCSFAIKMRKIDKYQAESFLNNSRYFLENQENHKKLIELASSFDALVLLMEIELEFNEKYSLFSEKTNQKLNYEYRNLLRNSQKNKLHGHALFLDYINENIEPSNNKNRIFVEIGTTRENIPKQGSTLELSQLCKKKNIKFITVDMDEHNSKWANFISQELDLGILAISKKGEDFLRDDIESFDFIFLDAYDFDHGNHSEIRQSRYKKNLGSKIDEEFCALMHLDCAKSVVKKLKKDGLVCIDDTWRDEDNKWVAKGLLAVPYFLDNNFEIVFEKNNAVLMQRKEKS